VKCGWGNILRIDKDCFRRLLLAMTIGRALY
jgi:hypothetical protein